jgi:hypothetical protein
MVCAPATTERGAGGQGMARNVGRRTREVLHLALHNAQDHFSIQDQLTLYSTVSWLKRVLALAVPIAPWALPVEPATGF